MIGMESLKQIAEQLPQPLWGRWERKEQLASAPDCLTYRLESKRMNRTETAVLKIIPLTAARAYFNDEQKQAQIAKAKERAERESDLLFRMQECPNIVTYQDEALKELKADGQLEGYAYLIRMEQLDCLTDRIRSHRYDLTEANVRALAMDLAKALAYAHAQGIMHRNIQPDKIFLSGSGTAKLGGFRVPTRTGARRPMQDSDAYTAPEIVYAKSADEFTPQADFYALGVCLYQMMNGMYLPFEKECDPDEAWDMRMNGEPFAMPENTSPAFCTIIRKCCAFNPAERYQSAEQLIEDLIIRKMPAQTVNTSRESEEEAGLRDPAKAEPVRKRAAFFAAHDEHADTEPEAVTAADNPPESEAEAVTEPESAAEALTEPEPAAETVTDPEPAAETITEPEPAAEAVTEPEPADEAVTEPDPAAETITEPEPAAETVSEPEPAAEAVTEPEPAAEAVTEPEPAAEAVTEPEPAAEAVTEPDIRRNPELAKTKEFPITPEQIHAEQEAERASFVMPQFTETLQELSEQMQWNHRSASDRRSQRSEAPAEERDEMEIEGTVLVHYNGSDERVRVPAGITRIGNGAFAGNRNLRTVYLPDGLLRLEEQAFSSCRQLEEVRFPDSLRCINNEAFRGCIALRSVRLRGSLTQIGASAFSGCRSMTAITLDCPIEKIGYDAFYDCSSLTDITVSEGSFAFRSIDGILFDYDGKHLLLYPAGRLTEDYIIPEHVYSIGDSAFCGCDHLERIKLTRNVQLIGSSAFRNCMKLREIIFPENLETIKNCAFQNCISLTRVNLPYWTAYIGAYAFSGCKQLSEVHLPSKLTELCMGIFEYCASLTQLRLPDGIVKIGEKAFISSGISELFVPYSVSRIEHRAFASCSGLRFIFLSNRINQIASDAFEKHSASLTIFGMTNSKASEYADTSRIRFEPMFALSPGNGYQVLHKYYGVFREVIIPPDVNVISAHAFQNCKSLHIIDLPSGIGEIGAEAFRGCVNLEKVTLTNLIMSVGENAFADCDALKELKITDLSQSYPVKVQRKIHRNFYRVLKEIRPETAEEYAKKYNAVTKTALFDISFARQAEKENQEHVEQLADEYENTVLLQALLSLIRSEMEKSERRLIQIELFGDCMITTGVMAGKTAIRRFLYRDLDAGVRILPNANHMQACAAAIIRELGDVYGLAPIQNKDSVLIQPVVATPRTAKNNA